MKKWRLPASQWSESSLRACWSQSTAFFFSQYPNRLTMARADILLAFLFLCLGSHTVFSTTTYQYISISRLNIASHITLAVAFGDSSKAIPLCLLNTAWQFLVVYIMPALHEDWFSICVDICIGSNFVMGVGIFTETWLLAEARAIVREKEASMSEAAVRAILEMSCDVFVPLSEDLVFNDDVPQMAAIMLRKIAARAGDSFLQHVKEEDRDRLLAFVAQGRDLAAQHKAQQICITLQDVSCQDIHVRIYHYCHLHPTTDGLTHFFGIVEEDAEQSAWRRGFTPSIAGLDASPGSVSFSRAADESDSDTESIASVRSASRPSPCGQEIISTWAIPKEPVKLRIKTWLHWELVDESAASRRMFNFLEAAGHPLDLLDRMKVPDTFLHWAQNLHTMAATGKDISTMKLDNLPVWNAGRTLCYMTNVRAALVSPPTVDGDGAGAGEVGEEQPAELGQKRAVDMLLTFRQPPGKAERQQRREQRSAEHRASSARASLWASAMSSSPSSGNGDAVAQTIGAQQRQLGMVQL